MSLIRGVTRLMSSRVSGCMSMGEVEAVVLRESLKFQAHLGPAWMGPSVIASHRYSRSCQCIHAVHIRVDSDGNICIPVHSHKCDLSEGEGVVEPGA